MKNLKKRIWYFTISDIVVEDVSDVVDTVKLTHWHGISCELQNMPSVNHPDACCCRVH